MEEKSVFEETPLTVFEEIVETMQEDMKKDEELKIKLKSLISEYFPFHSRFRLNIYFPGKDWRGLEKQWILEQ